LKRLVLPGCSILSIAFMVFAVWAHWPDGRLPAGARVDRLELHKSAHRLVLLHGGKVIASYGVALGPHPEGAKAAGGDGRTPEGTYLIDFHLASGRYGRPSLHVSYPNAADWQRAAAKGVDPGGPILVHAVPRRYLLLGRAHRFLHWTDGSIGLTVPEMKQVFDAVPDGTPIVLTP
jgi:murein L,D-transpeptidase YafK